MLNGQHSYKTASAIAMERMGSYTPSHHAFPHCKFVSNCFEISQRIDTQSQELDKHQSITCPTIGFNVYHLISGCSVHRRHPLDKKISCCLCLHDTASVPPAKLYTRKDLVTVNT